MSTRAASSDSRVELEPAARRARTAASRSPASRRRRRARRAARRRGRDARGAPRAPSRRRGRSAARRRQSASASSPRPSAASRSTSRTSTQTSGPSDADAVRLAATTSPLGLPELAAQGGERRPQARARALLEHVGPEHGRHPRRADAGPGDTRARPAATARGRRRSAPGRGRRSPPQARRTRGCGAPQRWVRGPRARV